MKRKPLFFGLTLALATVASTGFAQSHLPTGIANFAKSLPSATQGISMDYTARRRLSPAFARAVRSASRNVRQMERLDTLTYSDNRIDRSEIRHDARATRTIARDLSASNVADSTASVFGDYASFLGDAVSSFNLGSAGLLSNVVSTGGDFVSTGLNTAGDLASTTIDVLAPAAYSLLGVPPAYTPQ